MAQLLVRNLEPEVKTRLKRRAARRGHSLEEEVREILRQAVNDDQFGEAPLGERIVSRFAGIGLYDDIEEIRGQKPRPANFKE